MADFSMADLEELPRCGVTEMSDVGCLMSDFKFSFTKSYYTILSIN